jgi:hypothetical protein
MENKSPDFLNAENFRNAITLWDTAFPSVLQGHLI